MANLSKPKFYGGIDIGGTKILAVVAAEDGRILAAAKKKTKPDKGFAEVCRRAAGALREAAEAAETPLAALECVGVGAPSPVTPEGLAIAAVNMGWRMEPLSAAMAELLERPVFSGNDCDVGTYGEYVYGAGRGAGTLVGLFMGTGLGGGIVYRGRIVDGENHQSAELGHMIVKQGGRVCGCGHQGCLEAYAAKSGMGRRFAYEIVHQGRRSWLTEACPDGDYSNVKSSLLREGYARGDGLIVETLHEAARYLGVGVANFITILGPDVVVLGGGVMEALGGELLPLVKEAAKRATYPESSYKDTKILPAALGDNAVALGALAYAKMRREGGRCAVRRAGGKA